MENFTTCKICNNEIETINVTYNLSQCKKCDFIFYAKIHTQEEFIKVYDDLYNNTNAMYKNHSVTEFNNLISKKKIQIGLNRSKLIDRNIFKSNCKSVLEIGSGIGLVGSYIRQKNPNIQYTGIELDSEAYKKSKQLGLNTINADFTEIKHLNNTFDIIMLWEVIEHLQDLKLFLELAYSKLNTGGKIILSTPNYNKILNYPDREKDQLFQSLPPVHLNFFTTDNIKTIFELNNFKNCNAVLKKWPYLEIKLISFYINIIKTIFKKHQGTTIYFEATK